MPSLSTDLMQASPVVTSKSSFTESCNYCQRGDRLLLRCVRCKNAWYCDRQHQKEDWKVHKFTCVERANPDVAVAVSIKGAAVSAQSDGNAVDACKNQIETSSPPGRTSRSVSPTLSGKNSSAGSDLYKQSILQSAHGQGASSSTSSTPDCMNLNFSGDFDLPPSPAIFPVTADLLTERNSCRHRADKVVGDLLKQGYCIIDNFHGESVAQRVLWEVSSLRNSQRMRDGELIKRQDGSQVQSKSIRGDKITWIAEQEEIYESILVHMDKIDRLVRYCGMRLDKDAIRGRTPAMVACYPGNGSAYKRHIDNPHNDGRCITVLYYLNKGWYSQEHGGQLRMYPLGSPESLDVEPVFDRLLVFWSDRRTPHEVLPTWETRYAITLWYFNAKEREQFRRSYLENLATQFSRKPTQEQVKLEALVEDTSKVSMGGSKKKK